MGQREIGKSLAASGATGEMSTLWASEEEMWRETMKEVIGNVKDHLDIDANMSGDGVPNDIIMEQELQPGDAEKDEDSEISVNWERAYWRKGNRGGAVLA